MKYNQKVNIYFWSDCYKFMLTLPCYPDRLRLSYIYGYSTFAEKHSKCRIYSIDLQKLTKVARII